MKRSTRKLEMLITAVAVVLNFGILSSALEYHIGSSPDVQADRRGSIEQVNPAMNGYTLSSKQIVHYQKPDKNNLQSAISSPVQPGESRAYHPGDVVLIPVLSGVAADGQETQLKGCSNRPMDYEISTLQVDSRIIEEVAWYLGQGSGENAWYLMVTFQPQLEQLESYPFSLSISLQNNRTGDRSNTITLEGTFENLSKQVYPGTTNLISGATVAYTGADYTGEPITFSFADGVQFQDARLAPGQKIYLNLDRSYDNDLANAVRCFDLKFYRFRGEKQSFAAPGKLILPASGQEVYVYEVTGRTVQRLPSNYDDEAGIVSFSTDTLGYYVVSNTELI